MKKAFSFGRKGKRSSIESEKRKSLVIGSPFDFEHRETYGFGPLRTVEPGTVGASSMSGGAVVGGSRGTGVGVGAEAGLGGGSMSGSGFGRGAGSRYGGVGGTSTSGGLGRLDADGTAVSDDEDSAWEDYEATRVFNLDHNNSRRRG